MIHLVAAGSLRPFLKFKVSREQLPSCLPSSLVLQHTPNPSTETQQFQCSTCPLAQSVLSPEGTTRCSKLEKLGYDTTIFLISSFRAMAIAYYPRARRPVAKELLPIPPKNCCYWPPCAWVTPDICQFPKIICVCHSPPEVCQWVDNMLICQ